MHAYRIEKRHGNIICHIIPNMQNKTHLRMAENNNSAPAMRVRMIQALSPRRPTSYRPDAISCAGKDRRTCPYTRVPSACCSVQVKLVNDLGCMAY
eukprot:scaffold3234_cov166-Amphora_coffeaeformis.AAC.10